MKHLYYLTFLLALLSALSAHTQTTAIPDNAFEQALVDLGIDTDGIVNGLVLTADIDTITDLNVSDKLDSEGSLIKDLKGIEDFTALKVLDCSLNNLKSLDIGKNTALTELYCSENQLNELKLKNGNNTVLSILDATGNPNLSCLEVDNIGDSEGYFGWQKDPGAVYSENCHYGETFVPDDSFEKALIGFGYDSGELDDYVVTDSINQVTDLSVFNKGIFDLSGIEAFESLETLNCSNNRIAGLDLSKNVALIELNCTSNRLAALNIASNTALETLVCGDNLLTELLLSDNPELKTLDITSNQISQLNLDGNEALLSLKCSNNRLSSLSATKNTALTEIQCANNQLDSLNVAANTALNTLLCGSNQLKNFNLGKISSLTHLDVSSNQLKNLDVSFNTALSNLTCSENQLTSLNLTNNGSLTLLGVSDNQLSTLDLSKNTALESVACGANQLKNLDLSKNTALTSLECSQNNLKTLNIKNGNNTALTSFNALKNPGLQCIQIDALSAIGETWIKGDNASYSVNCAYSQTFVPDDAFEQALIDLGYDSGPLDNYVRTDSINTITTLDISDKIDASSNLIADLTGIKDFTALISLNCSLNQLQYIDVSQNPLLKVLNCADNQLQDLDVSANTSLTSLNCNTNSLKSLNIKNGNNSVLTTMDAIGNPDLSCIVVDDAILANAASWVKDATAFYSENCRLFRTFVPDDAFELALAAYDNIPNDNYVPTAALEKITNLDITNLRITDLTGIEDFKLLESLKCSNNLLPTLDLKSNTLLSTLECQNNTLLTLDISHNVHLTSLNCNNNQLTALSINNGNNRNLDLNATLNPNLECIEVDNVNEAEGFTNWQKDDGASYSTNCHLAQTYVPDDAFELALIAQKYDTILDNYVTTANIEKITALDINNLEIYNLQGIADFKALEILNCSRNRLNTLDLSGNKSLTNINCSSNQLTALNIRNGNNATLITLNAMGNAPNLTCLEVDNASEAEGYIDWQKDVSASYSENCYPDSTYVPDDAFEQTLIDLRYDSVLDNYVLTAAIDTVTVLNVNGALDQYGNALADLTGIEDFAALEELDCSSNQLDHLDLSNNNNLTDLVCNFNQLKSLDLGTNTELTTLNCGNNALQALDLRSNSALVKLDCRANLLTTLNIKNGNNSNLTLNATANPDLYCIDVDEEVAEEGGDGWEKDSSASYGANCFPTETYVPDDAFEQALIDMGLDDGPLDNYVPKAAVEILTGLDISGLGIADLTGIEDFISLETLNCSGNQLSEIDVSRNKVLTMLNCSDNQLESLDVRDNTILTTLDCQLNLLTSLNLKNENNGLLVTLNATGNPSLSCIEVDDAIAATGVTGWQKDSTATYNENCQTPKTFVPDDAFELALIALGYDSGPLDDYVATANISTVSILDVQNNAISDLTGIEGFKVLTTLICNDNQLIALDVSSNRVLTVLVCSNNTLQTLDLSKNVKLSSLDASNNTLVSLNVKNGTNTGLQLNATGNPNLACIEVDDPLAAALNGSWQIDATAGYSLNCAPALTYVPDDAFEQALIDLGYDNELDDYVVSSTINAITNLNVSGLGIANLKGLEGFKALDILNCSGNNLNNLDLRSNTALTDLNCSSNALVALILKNTSITNLDATGNPDLLCIEVDDPVSATNDPDWQEDLVASYNLDCHPTETYVPDDAFEQALIDFGYDSGPLDNYVATAAIDTVTVLIIPGEGIEKLKGLEAYILSDPDTEDIKDFIIAGGNIVDLTGIESFSALTTLVCPGNQINELNLNGNINLTTLVAAGNQLSILDISDNNALTTLEVSFNQLYQLDVVNNIALENLVVASNKLEQLDVRTNIGLITLVSTGNLLTELDVSDNQLIEGLDISLNQIQDIDLTSLPILKIFRSDFNQLTELVLGSNPELEILTLGNNYLTQLNVQNNTSLQVLQFPGNKVLNFDLDSNLQLQKLDCGKNLLTELDVSFNSELIELYGSSNHIANLIPTGPGNLNLKVLNVANNELQGINNFITNYPALESLNNADNKISELDISNKTDLKLLNTSNNFLTDLDITNNLVLEEVNCNTNQLTVLNFDASNSYNALTKLSCGDNLIADIIVDNYVAMTNFSCSLNELTALTLTFNVTLDSLNFSDNRLSSIDLSTNINLLNLNGSNNKLDTLAISTNTLLKKVNIANNLISGLNMDQNTAIEFLDISTNDLSEIELSALLNLKEFSSNSNQFKELNFSSNSFLTDISCRSNKLTQLNLKNGNYEAIEAMDATDNENLVCIEVDDVTYAESTEGWLKDVKANYVDNCHYSETYIPDDAFEKALADLGLDSGPLDDYVLTASIEVIEELNIPNKGILDMTGLQDFKALKSLDISSNQIDSLNLSANLELEILNAAGNQLDSLGLTDNSALKVLSIASNQFQIIKLNGLTDLQQFDCSNNLIKDLDLSFNTALTQMDVSSNSLVSLKLKNGNNISINNMDATGNPDLICIEVDDPAFSEGATGWVKDAAASYNEFCHFYETYVPDDAFEQALIAQGYDYNKTDPLDDYVPTAKIENLSNLNIAFKEITDLTGLEDFVNLITLNCQDNQLVSLDIRDNQLLETLNCSGNQLTILDISSNGALLNLNISDNQFVALDIGSSASLSNLNCSNNLLTSVDFAAYQALTSINCSVNQLTTITFSVNDRLRSLDCSYNELTALDITPNSDLESLKCRNNKLITMDANNGFNKNLVVFDVMDNPNLRCILIDDITKAQTYELGGNWRKDKSAAYKLECNDDDNDGVLDINDNCPNTRFGDTVDLFGCTYVILPASNFSILTTSETCRSSNNGKILISAEKTTRYSATIEVDGKLKKYNFTNVVEIRNLRAGIYELCLTVEEEPDYLNCYEILITEPQELSVTSKVSHTEKEISLEMSGGTSYTIDFNGLIFDSKKSDITLALDKGLNSIKIMADAECQGTYEKTIFITEDLIYFPNPFEDYLTIYIGNDDSKEVMINIYNHGGQLVLSKLQAVHDMTVRIRASQLSAGLYSVTLKTNSSISTFNIVKK